MFVILQVEFLLIAKEFIDIRVASFTPFVPSVIHLMLLMYIYKSTMPFL